MIPYVDTCILLSLFFRDSGTEAALSWLERCAAGRIVASHWALTEFVGAAGILARRGELTPELHREGIARFRRFCTERLTLEAPLASDFERAAIWLENFPSGVRAADALHLAIGARLGTVLCTADERLAAASERLGLPVAKLSG
jgi:predicted nucleic acid-binding protein